MSGIGIIYKRLFDDDHSGVEKPATIIMETVQAEGGIRVFEEDFIREVREFCDKSGNTQ